MSARIFPNLGTGRFKMRIGIYGIGKLTRNKAVRRFLCDFLGFIDRTIHTESAVGKYDFGAVRFQ